jgi:2-polyprenyl-3-methyl-5-hydroxy-6-metoxy-1,4-benzoquinol methylase
MIPSSELARIADRLYEEAPPVRRWMQRTRPYICPFSEIIEAIPAGSRLLDVGCGSGLLVGLLASVNRVELAVGFDSSAPAVAAARVALKNLDPDQRQRVEVRMLSVEEPWPEGEFDVVTIVDVVHHIPRKFQRDVLRQAAAKLSPGGLLLYKDIAPRPLWRATMNRLHDMVVVREWSKYVSAESVREWLEDEGCSQVSRTHIDMLWYRHDFAIFRKGQTP